MSSVQHLREFISKRLTAAAGEIFSEFEITIVQLEEEIDRQRRLLDISLKPQIKLHRIDLPQHYVWKEKEVLTNQQLWNQERKSSLQQEEAEPPQRKEEPDDPEPLQMIEEEHCVSQDEQQLVLKQETDTLMVTCPSEERDCSEPEANWFEPLSQNPPEAENQDQERGKNENSESSRDDELRQNKRRQQIKSHRNSLHNLRLKRPPESQTELPRTYVWKKEDAPTDQQLWNQERNSSLDQEDLEDNKEESEPTQIREEQQERCVSQDELQFSLKQETDTFMVTPEEGGGSEPEANEDQLLFQNRHKAKNQNQERSRNKDSKSNREGELKQNKRCSQTKGHRDDEVGSELESYTDDKPFLCKTCGKGFNHKAHLIVHIRSHTGEKPFSCQTCGKCFTVKSQLNCHMRTHTGEKPYICKICGKRLSHSGSLTLHMRTHTGEKPFSCEICGKSFSQSGSLIFHMRAHTGETPYSCDICGKCFRQKSNLNLHMPVHTGEKPYSCKACGKCFARNGQLTYHMRTHTREKPLV